MKEKEQLKLEKSLENTLNVMRDKKYISQKKITKIFEIINSREIGLEEFLEWREKQNEI